MAYMFHQSRLLYDNSNINNNMNMIAQGEKTDRSLFFMLMFTLGHTYVTMSVCCYAVSSYCCYCEFSFICELTAFKRFY